MAGLNKFGLIIILLCSYAYSAGAAPLPGPADIDRVRPELHEQLPSRDRDDITIIKEEPTSLSKPPEGAETVFFKLKSVKVEGSTVFSEDELEGIYGKYLNQEISLDKVWIIADQITSHYREAGYFLSRAYVPAQEIESGNITIKVIEGYVDNVKINSDKTEHIVQEIIDDIKRQKPLKIKFLEHQLLLLNDLPGIAYKATLQPLDNSTDGGVELVLQESHKAPEALISFDNFGSRFLGPYQAQATVRESFLPMQLTTIHGFVSVPADELKSVSASHQVTLTPATSLQLDASYSEANPGYSLEIQDIESKSNGIALSLTQQIIRQRQENLQIKFGFDVRNTETDILGFPLTRDNIRAVRIGANYDRDDDWSGYNYAGIILSQGIDGLGSSNEDDLLLSRTGIKPDFFKAEISYTRIQSINDDWSALFSLAGQKASGSLFSSEEFGYGGQGFGRAYDTSEISGDNGIASSLELHYQGLPEYGSFDFQPYGFYDIGKVWNRNPDQIKEISGSSTGLGVRIYHKIGFSSKFEVAWPLTKTQDTPLYGMDNKDPRYLFQISYQF